jgi:uncharacterized protein
VHSGSLLTVSQRNRSLLFLLVFAMLLSGCKRKEEPASLRPARVHTITREMLRAAGSVIHESGHIQSKLEFDGLHSERADTLQISLNPGASAQTQKESVARIVQSLDRIATANALTRDDKTSTGDLTHLEYRRSGVRTHSIEITVQSLPQSATPAGSAAARLAIILDDLGSDRHAADAIFALPYPLTISILPHHPQSVEIAQEAHRRGYQVMLHLPMQAVGNERPETQELHAGMSASDVAALVDQWLQGIPDVAGVNNHQGSQSTADARLMDELMPVLRQRQLFYVDSRTTAATVAYDEAQRLGVRSGFRNVPFLDDVAEVGAVRRQLQLALRGAREKGEAIAIGHPHPATLEALREVLPQAESEGVNLVFVSELVH